jgi:acetyltransferase
MLMLPIERWTLPDGTPLLLRAVRSHDADALNALIEGLSPLDRRWRFHGAVTGVTRTRLEHMTRVNPGRELALVVTTTAVAGETLVADARCVTDATGHDAEFALMVARTWRRRGIGEHALAALQCLAAQRGLRWLYGSVRADNAPMLALVRRRGFHCTPQRGDRQRMAVEARLQPPFTSTEACSR